MASTAPASDTDAWKQRVTEDALYAIRKGLPALQAWLEELLAERPPDTLAAAVKRYMPVYMQMESTSERIIRWLNLLTQHELKKDMARVELVHAVQSAIVSSPGGFMAIVKNFYAIDSKLDSTVLAGAEMCGILETFHIGLCTNVAEDMLTHVMGLRHYLGLHLDDLCKDPPAEGGSSMMHF